MYKRGQLTIFIIIAILVVVVVIGVFVFFERDYDDFADKDFDTQVSIIKEDVLECFDIIYSESLIYIGSQGGYAEKPVGYYMINDGVYLPIYYYKGETNIPTKEFIEDEISFAVDSSLDYCLELAIEMYPYINIDYQNHSTIVLIKEDDVEFITDVLISFEFEDQRKILEMNSYPISIKSDLSKMIFFAEYYISSQIVDDTYFCLTCIFDVAQSKNLRVEFFNYAEDVVIISSYSNDEETLPQYFDFLEVINSSEEVVIPIYEISFLNDEDLDEVDNELNISAPYI